MKKVQTKTKYSKLKKYLPLYVMFIPGAVYLIINNYLPMFGLQVAFKQYNPVDGIWGSKFIGFKNFEFLVKSSDFGIIFRNTLLYNLVFLFLGAVLAVLLAVFLNEVRSKTHLKILQTIILIPSVISMIVVSYIVYGFLASNGVINNMLTYLGLENVDFYKETSFWPFILSFVNFWKNLGMSSIVYYAAIVSFDESYYEAADLDGASAWKKARYITIPLLKPTIIMMLVIGVGRICASDLSLFYYVPQDQGALFSVTNTIDTYVYRALLRYNDVGMSSAAGALQSVIGFILVIIVNALSKKGNDERALF